MSPTQQIRRLQQVDVLMIPDDGWIPVQETWKFNSTDSPSFVIDVQANVTGTYGLGYKVKCIVSGTYTFQGFITKETYSTGVTSITVYGGTDYALPSGTITASFISNSKSPFGFPISPDKWTVTATNSSDNSQTPPVVGTWYNLGTVSISIPIGLWITSYSINCNTQKSTSVVYQFRTTLSTGNNTESDTSMTVISAAGSFAGGLTITHKMINKLLSLASKTIYYANSRSDQTADTLNNFNSQSTLVISAVCAYL